MTIKNLFQSLPALMLMVSPLIGCSSEISEDENPAQKEKNEQEAKSLDHLIIQEICYGGSQQERIGFNGKPEMEPYTYDAYIKIYNPTGKTQYLDGLALALSPFSSSERFGLDTEGLKYLNDNLAAERIIKFPGKGTDYPIEAGKSVLLTSMAIDHRKNFGEESFIGSCANSYDLTKADFEWWTKEQIEDEEVKDNPNVPNMIMVYADNKVSNDPTATKFEVGETMIALVKLDVKNEAELKDPKYIWNYVLFQSSGEGGKGHGHKMGEGPCFKIPNAWVIDAVSLCPTEQFKKVFFSKDLDAGCTGVRKTRDDNIRTYGGNAVIRKHDGKNYVDTNNSTVDFEVKRASMAIKK